MTSHPFWHPFLLVQVRLKGRLISSLRRVKTHLRSAMGQQRLNFIALTNIERAYANQTIATEMEQIINSFGKEHGRDKHFF